MAGRTDEATGLPTCAPICRGLRPTILPVGAVRKAVGGPRARGVDRGRTMGGVPRAVRAPAGALPRRAALRAAAATIARWSTHEGSGRFPASQWAFMGLLDGPRPARNRLV